VQGFGDWLLQVLSKIRVHDVVGMGFAGVAAYGLVTHQITGGDENAAIAIAAGYLGLRANGTIKAEQARALTKEMNGK